MDLEARDERPADAPEAHDAEAHAESGANGDAASSFANVGPFAAEPAEWTAHEAQPVGEADWTTTRTPPLENHWTAEADQAAEPREEPTELPFVPMHRESAPFYEPTPVIRERKLPKAEQLEDDAADTDSLARQDAPPDEDARSWEDSTNQDVDTPDLPATPASASEAAEAIAAAVLGEEEAQARSYFHEEVTDESRASMNREEAATEVVDPIDPVDQAPRRDSGVSVKGIEISRRPSIPSEPTDPRRRVGSGAPRVIVERDASSPNEPELVRKHSPSFNEEATLVPPENRHSDEAQAQKVVELGTGDLGSDRIIGVDFGGRWIRIGVMERNELELIPAGDAVYVPAMIAVRKDGTLALGSRAKAIAMEEPGRAISPRAVLHALAPGSINPKRAGAANIVSYEGGNALIKIGDRRVALHDMLVEFFQWLRMAIEEHLKTTQIRAMISVPHDLDPEARMMMRRACTDAGLRIARLESEPNAAIRAYNLFERPVDNALLVDFGASHLGVTLLKRGREAFGIVANEWWDDVSARDLDLAIAELALEAWNEQSGQDYSGDADAKERVVEAVERARLDIRRAPTLEIKVVLGDSERTITLQRSQIYQLTETLVGEICGRAQKVSREGGVDPRALGAVLLAGSGATYPPLVQSLQNLTTVEPLLAIPPSHLFTHGLARSGRALERQESAARPDALEASIGLELPGGRFRALINAGEKLPAKLVRPFPIRDGQTEADLRLYQGDAEFVRSCRPLGTLHLGVPRSGAKVEMEMAVDPDGILDVTIRETTTGASERLNVATQQTPADKMKAIPALVRQESEGGKKPPPKSGGFLSRLFGKK